MKFTVDRKTWARGLGPNYMLSEGMSCCLGHCMRNLGWKAEYLDGLSFPEQVVSLAKIQYKKFVCD